MANSNSSSSGGTAFVSLLTILFIALKLTHVIDWSWWWVLSPMWISFCIAIVAMILYFAFVWFYKKRKK